MAAPVLQLKRGLLANLPGLRAGEPGFTTDSYDLYVGIDSTTTNNKFFGSHRYWTRGTATTGSGVNFVEGTNNGTQYITLKSPDSLAGIVTYTLPGTQGSTSSVLTNDGNGILSWASGSNNATFSGITTFIDTTDNTLGNENTGSVQLDGGMGITKNLTVKQNLHVGGYSEFVGVVTFKGGTINLGDSNTDNINVSGEFVSNLVPNTDDTYDLGTAAQRWRNATFSGIGTFANRVSTNTAFIGYVRIGVTNSSTIDTPIGSLNLDSANSQVVVNNGFAVTGVSTFTGLVVANGGLTANGQVGLNTNLSVGGISTFTGLIDANGGIDVSGGESVFSSATVSDLTSGRVVLAGTSGALQDNSNLTFGVGGLTVGAGGVNVTGVSTFSTDLVIGGDIRVNGSDIQASDGATNITLTSNTLTTFAGDIKVTGNDIQASDGSTNISLTSNTLTTFAGDVRINGNDIQASDGSTNITLTSNTLTTFAGDIKVTGNDIQASDGTATISMSGANVTVAGDLTVGGNDIKASDGTTALSFSNSTGAVTAANDLTINGNLYVSGNTTQVNTAALSVEDRTIDLGIVNGATPASATTWDLGVLFNYHSGGSAKKSAVIWEHGDSRFKFASVLSTDADGTNNDSPQLSVTTFSPIEISALWINDCAGQHQVISCSGSTRYLNDITIDAGSF